MKTFVRLLDDMMIGRVLFFLPRVFNLMGSRRDYQLQPVQFNPIGIEEELKAIRRIGR